jgi:hypothetical protein
MRGPTTVAIVLLIGSLLGVPATAADPASAVQSTDAAGPPTRLSARAVVGRVELHWGWPQPLPTDGEITGWIVARRVNGGSWATLATTGTDHHVDLTPTPGHHYEYRVRATGPDGDGTWAAPVPVSVPRHDLVGSRFGRLGAISRVALHEPLHELGYGSRGRPATSPDGRRTLISQMVDTTNSHLWLVPTYGSGAASQLTSMSDHALDPAWSPDGSQIAFTREEPVLERPFEVISSVWVVPAQGGAPRLRAKDAAEPAWDRDGSLLVTDLSGATPRLVRAGADGSRRAINGTSGGRHAAVSPDGRLLAFTVPGSSTGPSGVADHDRALAVLPLHSSSASAVVTELADGGYGAPTWHPDGRSLAAPYGQRRWLAGRAHDTHGLASLALGTRTPPRLRPTVFAADGQLGRSTYRALGVHLISAPARTGGATRIGFAMHDAPPGTTYSCRLDDGPAEACTSPWRGRDLSTGAHHLVIEAQEPAGQRTVTSHRWQADATAPVVKLSDPGPVTLTKRATIDYLATDADGVASYDVRYRRARFDGSFEPWVRPETWQATAATSRSISMSRGYEHCFSVRARDTLGNVSAWSPPRCTSRPLDDPSLKASAGWSRATGTKYLDGTISTTKRQGEELTRSNVQATRVWLVATRCATCGTADVFVGSTRVGRVDLTADTTQRQQVIALPASSSVRTGKLTVRVTSSGKRVEIDGVAFRRS